MKPFRFIDAIDKLEYATWLDPLVKAAETVAKKVIRPQWIRDILHGVPQGHPLHPPLVQVPIGAWLSAGVLDVLPGTHKQAKLLIGVGTIAAAPAAAAGYTDFTELHEQQKRTAIVHSTLLSGTTALYAASWLARRQGNHRRGKQLSYIGLAAAGMGGFLGGVLSFRQASGVNHTEDVFHRISPGWHSIGRLEDFAQGKLQKSQVGQVPVTVYRYRNGGSEASDQILVLADACSHLSGPLSDGSLLDGETDSPCVQCPWHGSVFSLRDGQVLQGPATARQPSFHTRIQDGVIEACLPGAG